MSRPGFTLIELIMVVAMIAVVASTVFVAIDPARRLQTARNATRWADITAILEAIKKYQFDHDGVLPAMDEDFGTVQMIGERAKPCSEFTCAKQPIAETECVLRSFVTDLRPYLKTIPEDPKTGNRSASRYYVNRDEYGIVSVGACDSEAEGQGGEGEPPVIEVTR
jgi:prepilin-type N-terminal cleavage/methylation domain-containing protein